MSDAWLIVAAVGLGTMALKAAGPLLLGTRPLPERARRVVALLAPALLAALVATAAVATGQQLVADARLIGLGVGILAIALRAPILVVVLAAAAATALASLAGIG